MYTAIVNNEEITDCRDCPHYWELYGSGDSGIFETRPECLAKQGILKIRNGKVSVPCTCVFRPDYYA